MLFSEPNDLSKIAVRYGDDVWTYEQWWCSVRNLMSDLKSDVLIVENEFPPSSLLWFCVAAYKGIAVHIVSPIHTAEERGKLIDVFPNAEWRCSSRNDFSTKKNDSVEERNERDCT
ncbi:MAG: hypothetical protein ACRCWQ_02915, partial [Bacilli bacterium]